MKAQTVIDRLQKMVAENPELRVFGILFEDKGTGKEGQGTLVAVSLLNEAHARVIKGACKTFGV